jgi:hypothetical protein
MPRYAAQTEVTVERTRAEIEATLRRYGASKFTSGWDEDTNTGVVMFHINGFYVRFTIPLPTGQEKEFTHFYDKRGSCWKKRTEQQRTREAEQATRQRWRALLLAIKGKLEAVECKISSIEAEFLAFIVMPNDKMLVEWLRDALPQIKAGTTPQLGYSEEVPQDAEFETKPAQEKGGQR